MRTMRPFAFAALFATIAVAPAVASPCFELEDWGSYPTTDQVVLVRSLGGSFMSLHLVGDKAGTLYRATLDCDENLRLSHCVVAGFDEHVSMEGDGGDWTSLHIKTTVTFETPTSYPQLTGSTTGPVSLHAMDDAACTALLAIPPAEPRGIVVHPRP